MHHTPMEVDHAATHLGYLGIQSKLMLSILLVLGNHRDHQRGALLPL